MPEMNGMQAANQIRQLTPTPQIVLISTGKSSFVVLLVLSNPIQN
jgi:CheY-like chemotaxis protein